MEIVGRWQRRVLLACAGVLSVWLLGCLAIFLDTALAGEQRLQLKQKSSQRYGELAIPPITDGQGGLCLQGRDGRLSRIMADGSPGWRVELPTHFELLCVQQGEGYLVLADRWGQALAINEDGSERWRFAPVHHEQAAGLTKRRGNEARFYTMSSALIYGLDERGVQQWVRRISSGTSIASQRPWMMIDPTGSMLTRCNYGKLRVSPTGELLVLRGPDVWEMEIMDTDETGRILEYGNGKLYVSDSKGTKLFEGPGLSIIPGSGFYDYWPELDGAWLTSDGYALLNYGNYTRFDRNGTQLRMEVRAGEQLSCVALGDEQLRLLRGSSYISLVPLFFDKLLSGFGREIPDPQENEVNAMGRSELLLELSVMSVEVLVPNWLERGSYSMYGLGTDHLLCLNQCGLARVCQLSGAGR